MIKILEIAKKIIEKYLNNLFFWIILAITCFSYVNFESLITKNKNNFLSDEVNLIFYFSVFLSLFIIINFIFIIARNFIKKLYMDRKEQKLIREEFKKVYDVYIIDRLFGLIYKLDKIDNIFNFDLYENISSCDEEYCNILHKEDDYFLQYIRSVLFKYIEEVGSYLDYDKITNTGEGNVVFSFKFKNKNFKICFIKLHKRYIKQRAYNRKLLYNITNYKGKFSKLEKVIKNFKIEKNNISNVLHIKTNSLFKRILFKLNKKFISTYFNIIIENKGRKDTITLYYKEYFKNDLAKIFNKYKK